MYKVFLVEDEIIIRESIRELVDWEAYGFEFIGDVSDGEVAWPVIQKQRPDIVITDIKMPFMDGMELSRLIKKEMPDISVIILSGYSDFDFACEAVNMGVDQYLLKPLSKDNLTEALVELRERKDKEQEQKRYYARFELEIQEGLRTSRRDFFDALVSGNLSASELLNQADKLNMDLVAERYGIVLFLVEKDAKKDSETDAVLQIQSDIVDAFPDSGDCVMFDAGMDVMALLVKGGKEDLETSMRYCIEKIKDVCATGVDSGCKWLVVQGQPVERLSAVSECYKDARNKLFFQPDTDTGSPQNIVSIDLLSAVDFDSSAIDMDKMDSKIIDKFLVHGTHEDIQKFVEGYFDEFIAEAEKSALLRHYIAMNIRLVSNAFLKRIGAKPVKSSSEGGRPAMQDSLGFLCDTKAYAERLLEEVLKQRDVAAAAKHKDALHEVLAYIDEHYSDPDINLNTVARVASVTPTHFCTIFVRHIGKTFIEYLTDMRMEKARELLLYTSLASGEIAFEVGYNDPHYFSYIFKKTNGCSPRNFRKDNQQE